MIRMIQALINPLPTAPRVLRNQRNRRMLTFGFAITLVSSLVLLLRGQTAMALGFLIVNAALAVMLTIATRNVSGSIDEQLDERERHIRDHVYRISYWTLTGVTLFLLGGLAGVFASANRVSGSKTFHYLVEHVGQSGPLEVYVVTFILVSLFSTFPTAVLAWLEPDPFED